MTRKNGNETARLKRLLKYGPKLSRKERADYARLLMEALPTNYGSAKHCDGGQANGRRSQNTR
jgi:hypothetical protein